MQPEIPIRRTGLILWKLLAIAVRVREKSRWFYPRLGVCSTQHIYLLVNHYVTASFFAFAETLSLLT